MVAELCRYHLARSSSGRFGVRIWHDQAGHRLGVSHVPAT